MRILLATGIYPPDIGGPATYAAQLFEHLPKRGIEAKIVTYADRKSKRKTQNSRQHISTVSRRFPKGIRHLAYFFAVLRHGSSADLIYALDTVSAGLSAGLAAKILRKPFLVKVVGDYAWEQQQVRAQQVSGSTRQTGNTIEEFQKRRYGFVTEMRRAVQNFVVRSAVMVITPSEYLKNIIAGWGVDREKIEVVHNAVITPHGLPNKEEARTELGLKGTILLSAGRLVPWKGFRTLITLMAEIKRDMPNAQLFVIGSGPEAESLKTYVHEKSLGECVRLVGSVSHGVLWRYLRASDVFLLNTAYEGFSHQLIEAMAAGAPVVSTAIGGNPEIIEDGAEGFLVPYDSAETFRQRILSLLGDQKQRTEIQERAKKKAAQFSLERMLGDTVKVMKAKMSKSKFQTND